ncbi:MAG TPA: NAD(P)-dependent oxidoreductase [Amycolatopsis sp.]|nr:NAD(P)-dependent oxidoreductase [Amycolatopsis sp.]
MAAAGLKLGWIGTGRMGYALVSRLLQAGHEVAVYNRTRAKAEPLTELGARVVDRIFDLADADVVFTTVAASDDFRTVIVGPNGLLSVPGRQPQAIVDCSTVSAEVSAEVREAAEKVGTRLIAAPVSGNAKVVKAGKLSIVASGPADTYAMVEPLLKLLGTGVTYVGDGEGARLVKLAHNLFLGVVSQSLAEITVLAEKGGVSRHAFLEFLNNSVLGSMFTRYKTPQLVNLDLSPTFTTRLLRKDFDLGLAEARALEVPMPLAAATAQIVQSAIGAGYGEQDFAALLPLAASASGMELTSENVEVDDGLGQAS